MSIRLSNGNWFGHDRQIQMLQPEGMNASYLDGSARWSDHFNLEVVFSNVMSFYWPKPD